MSRKKFTTSDSIIDQVKEIYEKNKNTRELEINYVDPEEIEVDLMDEEFDEYTSNEYTSEVSFVEFAIINSYLHDLYVKKETKDLTVKMYGGTDNIGRITIGGSFHNIDSFWFGCSFTGQDNEWIVQTKMFTDGRGDLINQLHITCKVGLKYKEFEDTFKKIKSLAFNNSQYKGKCIKISLIEGNFRGVSIIDIKEASNELIMTDTQRRYIEHFITRVARGGSARYLLNGEPGTGKTESIREICRRLVPDVTFIIPDFTTTGDLNSIMEACEIFENAVIIMDDIDLYLGSRDNGSYTRMLGQFLSFFDGVKKRKISLLASTNDKGLVDKAAERPGRFNFTLDYTFLNEEQIIKVCDIHLPEKWQIKEVYDALSENINGKKPNITGAFIANLAENIVEMSEEDELWTTEDTISLIKESYKGFYMSQVEKEKKTMGFVN
jgi:SpoVK/Ycf46/Vps4 family AAA+-type ATPase